MSAQQALAHRKVELRKRIDASGDPDLMALIEDHDTLSMSLCGYREIGSDWAREIREIVPGEVFADGCDCFSCTVSKGLRWLRTATVVDPHAVTVVAEFFRSDVHGIPERTEVVKAEGFFQLTYDKLRSGPEGDDLAHLDDGVWRLDHEIGPNDWFTDVVFHVEVTD